ncbi:MAG: peptidoglycan-binding protein, partial [Devosiaceae bacterium]|nr:peptidoglycan-binding protein [Devosiaceae bacterium]
FVSPWPIQTKFPNLAQRIAIQNRLAQLGFYQGEVDGRIGPITQEAYKQYQLSNGILADGFITLETFYQLGG